MDKSIGGTNASFSLDENEFTQMIKAIQDTEKAIGKETYELTEKQRKGKDFSRSLYLVKDVEKGDIITEENVRSIRPGFGMHPKYLKEILGKRFSKEVEKGKRFSLDFLED